MRSKFGIEVKEAPAQVMVADESGCRHYWLIESPNGASSRGICKLCNEEREFNNSLAPFVLRKVRPPVKTPELTFRQAQ